MFIIRYNSRRLRRQPRFDNADNRQRHLKGLYRMISGVDRNVGRIAAALQRHELARDTVIIFASDHGMYYGERGLSDCWQLNEQPLRVPLIVCDPRRDPGGWRRTELALNIDVAPTILDLAGVPVPDLMQGRSLVPLFEDDPAPGWRTEFFCEHLFERSDIPRSEGCRTEHTKYLRYFDQTRCTRNSTTCAPIPTSRSTSPPTRGTPNCSPKCAAGATGCAPRRSVHRKL